MKRKINIVEIDLGKQADVNATLEDFDCTGEQPMYDPFGKPSKSLMFASYAIKYKLQAQELQKENDKLKKDLSKMKQALELIASGNAYIQNAKDALK